MNRLELVNVIAEKTGATKKDTENMVAAFVDTVKEALQNGDKVQLVGFGTFEVKVRPEHKGHNPATGAEIVVPETKAPAFKPGKVLKDLINQ